MTALFYDEFHKRLRWVHCAIVATNVLMMDFELNLVFDLFLIQDSYVIKKIDFHRSNTKIHLIQNKMKTIKSTRKKLSVTLSP